MNNLNLKELVKSITEKTGFAINREIYRGIYYTKDNIRNIIFSGSYKHKPAVLKIYKDPRILYESLNQSIFNRLNKSKVYKAPKVYKYEMFDKNTGYLIMEKLPVEGSFIKAPVKDKKEFLDFFLEYKKNFPVKPFRKISIIEELPASEFHVYRINRWLELGFAKESELISKGGKRILISKNFLGRYLKSINLIRLEFKNRKMVWSHGHFKPQEIYKMENSKFYLTDFAHCKMYPEGYELAFIIWADCLIAGNWKLNYKEWRKPIFEWVELFKPIASKLKIKDFDSLIKASLIERTLGTILADVCASDRPRKEKEKRVKLLYKLLDELLN